MASLHEAQRVSPGAHDFAQDPSPRDVEVRGLLRQLKSRQATDCSGAGRPGSSWQVVDALLDLPGRPNELLGGRVVLLSTLCRPDVGNAKGHSEEWPLRYLAPGLPLNHRSVG